MILEKKHEQYNFIFTDDINGLDVDLVSKIPGDLDIGLPNHKITNYFTLKVNIFDKSDYFAIAIDTNNLVVGLMAFKTYEINNEQLLQIETFIISEKYHGKMLGMQMVSFSFLSIVNVQGDLPIIISMKTYNPRSYVIMKKFTDMQSDNSYMYPVIGSNIKKSESQSLASKIAHLLESDRTFDAETGVIKDIVGGFLDDFWPSFPSSRNKIINEYFKKNVTTRDRMLVFLYSKDAHIRKHIIKTLESI